MTGAIHILPTGSTKLLDASEALLSAVRRIVPAKHRTEVKGVIFISALHLDVVRKLAMKYGCLEVDQRHQATSESSYKTLHLLPTAPIFVVEAVWKAFTRVKHPDVGGDPEEFLILKKAYETIKKL